MTPAVEAVRKAGVTFELHEYKHDPGTTAFGEEAAEAMGVDPFRTFKTLVASVDDRLVVGVVCVLEMLDLKELASAAKGKRAAMADAAVAERATGYVVGGISPLGQKKRLPTFVDASASVHDTVFVSAGRRGLEIELSPLDLVALTGGSFSPIAR